MRTLPAGCRRYALVIASLLLFLSACPSDAPQTSLIQEAQEREERANSAPAYVKAEGLHIDIPYLAGRSWDSLAPEVIADQLGTELGRQADERWGITQIDFGNRQVHVYQGRIQYISYTFDAPMDPSTAMGVCGFPLRLPERIDSTMEIRLVHYWGLRQISLRRVEKKSDMIGEIRVTVVRPQEMETLPDAG